MKSTFTLQTIALATLVLSSCVPSSNSSLRSRDSANSTVNNVPVGLYQGRVLEDNPIILSGNPNLADTYNLNTLLSTATITSNNFLQGNSSCYGLDHCFEVRNTKDAPSALQTTNGKWAFNASTPEFLEVNTFYHLNRVSDMFYKNLFKSYNRAYDSNQNNLYDTALPKLLMPIPGIFNVLTSPLIAYSNCDVADNAYFDRANTTLCFGYISGHDGVKWAQDSTVVYHETGHFFQKLQLNFRNIAANPARPDRVDMGNSSYDEAGSIGEGLSDFYSFYVNGRTHFAEWGAGRFLSSSRPISENDSLHIPVISTAPDQRLSYPTYINYNPNESTIPVEDIHYTGMIVSHYLTALTQDLQDKCLFTKRDASDTVIHLISETLAELGDLGANGTESTTSANRINLNSSYSKNWFNTANPINFRSFMQTFAKNLLNNLGNPLLNRCNGGVYNKDQIENLIDQYGLLLFKTYNQNRDLSDPVTKANTTVNSVNRKKSVLISKDLLILDPTTNASSAYVIDNHDQILAGITSMQASGVIGTLSPQTPSDLGFNNNNGKVSPGEVVAIALNLYNNANSPMGGIQVLANDWNHADANGKPCIFTSDMSNDKWPLVSEGGVPCSSISTSVPANFAPVCFIQSNDANSTTWISQSAFKTKIALDISQCLDSTNDKDCFIRAIKGADQSHYSKLNPKSTWGQTLADPKTGKAPSLDWGNILLFEVSKHIPPGTVVDCRLRVRFTNCDDCYHKQSTDSSKTNYFIDSTHQIDGYDFTDTDYNGPKPFKIIHLQIPITD